MRVKPDRRCMAAGRAIQRPRSDDFHKLFADNNLDRHKLAMIVTYHYCKMRELLRIAGSNQPFP